jgi:hypothetical protein
LDCWTFRGLRSAKHLFRYDTRVSHSIYATGAVVEYWNIQNCKMKCAEVRYRNLLLLLVHKMRLSAQPQSKICAIISHLEMVADRYYPASPQGALISDSALDCTVPKDSQLRDLTELNPHGHSWLTCSAGGAIEYRRDPLDSELQIEFPLEALPLFELRGVAVPWEIVWETEPFRRLSAELITGLEFQVLMRLSAFSKNIRFNTIEYAG